MIHTMGISFPIVVTVCTAPPYFVPTMLTMHKKATVIMPMSAVHDLSQENKLATSEPKYNPSAPMMAGP